MKLNRPMKVQIIHVPRRRRSRRPKCGAQTRRGTACLRQALKNGRCPNHGGMSTGPKTAAGRARIAAAQRERHARRRREGSMGGFNEVPAAVAVVG